MSVPSSRAWRTRRHWSKLSTVRRANRVIVLLRGLSLLTDGRRWRRRTDGTPRERSRPRGLLVASSGGHLQELLHLSSGLPDIEWQWVAFDTPDARQLLAGRHVCYAHHPTNRNLRNLVRNTILAWRVVRRTRPSVAISTGAGVAVPFLWMARLRGARVIYVESYARTSGLSLTGRLVIPVVHRLFVQWPEAREGSKAEYVGPISRLPSFAMSTALRHVLRRVAK